MGSALTKRNTIKDFEARKRLNKLDEYICEQVFLISKSKFKLIFSKEGITQMGGFGAMGSLFSPVWDWPSFWSLTALLSIILAFMNILPIPALDGGHVLFLLYEIVTGRKPSDKFLEYAQIIGMVLVISLVLLANGNDIIRSFFK